MNEQDRIWMAGFFDGEGNIQLYFRTPTYSNRYGQYSLRVFVVNTNRSILDPFSDFGGRVFQHSPVPTGWKVSYHWYITGSKAKAFLEAIFPYLKLKKEIAKLGIELQASIEAWKHSFGSKRLSTQEIAKRNALIAKFRQLQPSDGRGRKPREPRKVAF